MKIEKPECKKCGSKQVLFRRTTKTLYCRVCGHEWKRKVKA